MDCHDRPWAGGYRIKYGSSLGLKPPSPPAFSVNVLSRRKEHLADGAFKDYRCGQGVGAADGWQLQSHATVSLSPKQSSVI